MTAISKTSRQLPFNMPKTRPSILNPCLDGEPWIDHCPCAEKMILFVDNHPIAVIAGSQLEYTALNMRLNQLRHRERRRR